MTDINEEGRALVKSAEGLRLVAYPDPATGHEPFTIGYGHTGTDVWSGKRITLSDAEDLLSKDLAYAAKIVDGLVKVTLSQNQRAALVSFVYNVGKGRAGVKDGFMTLKNGRPSSMLLKLNSGDMAGAADEFLNWTMPGSAVHAGLLKRRNAERALFLTPDEDK